MNPGEGGTVMNSALRVESLDEGIRLVIFDQPGSSANVFSQAVLAELDETVRRLAQDPALRGIIFASAKKNIFIAGADLKEFRAELGDEQISAIIRRGQQVFQAIAELRVPTVAAIHGACLGGGCELALACTWRIASSDPATKIGLPETMLGILPAWGGSTRLPRLVGLPAALGAVLAGARMSAKKAQKIGLVDKVVPREHLVRVARGLFAGARPERASHRLTNNPLAARIIARQARKSTLKKTGGHYPAPLRALDVMVRGIGRSVAYGHELERQAILELVRGKTAGNLVGIFLLQERAKGLRYVPPQPGVPGPAPVGNMAVIGAGLMGAGIAQWAAARGHRVILADIDDAVMGKGIQSIAGLFAAGVKRHTFDKAEARRAMDRIVPVTTEVPLRVDLVIEAAAENLEVKRRLFASLERRSSPDTILATNTSSLPIAQIAEGLERPERVVGIHFFNPVHKMQLVEIIVGERTDPAVVDRAVAWVQAIGKLPVVCKDSPGFLVNRILMPYLIEAGLLFAEGASIREIDAAMKKFGMPMGPLRLMDEIGLDVGWHAAAGMASAFAGRLPTPHAMGKIVEAGFLGRKSGAGFYRYHEKNVAGVNGAVSAFVQGDAAKTLGRRELQERMVMPLVNEAARTLEEGIVAAPEDVDLGMVLGTGFAPFRGGPLRWLDELGAAKAVEMLETLAARFGERFRACTLLRRMAERGETFYGQNRPRSFTAGAEPVEGARPSVANR